jgi:hypothetical protein
MPIARQRVAKHIPTEANAWNNRFTARQRRGKQPFSNIQAVYFFSWGQCKVVIRGLSSEVGSGGSTEGE